MALFHFGFAHGDPRSSHIGALLEFFEIGRDHIGQIDVVPEGWNGELSGGAERSPPRQFFPDGTIAMCGYDFREGQVVLDAPVITLSSLLARGSHRFGEIFPANVCITIFPFCTMKVSEPSSKRLSAVSAFHTM